MVRHNMLGMCEEKQDISEVNFKFAIALDLKNCAKQIKLPISLHTCAPFSELPSNTSTMVRILPGKLDV